MPHCLGEWQWEHRLLELGSARSFQGLVQGPRVLWYFGQDRGGFVNKSCANPWLFMGPLPWAKAAARVSFAWTWNAQLPGQPDTMDRWIMGCRAGHVQHPGECSWPQNGGNEVPKSLGSTVGARALSAQSLAALGHSLSQALHFKPGQEVIGCSRALDQGHLAAGRGIWSTCLCGAIWN